MYRPATVKPIKLASSAGSRISDTDHVKRQLRAAASLDYCTRRPQHARLVEEEISGDCLIVHWEFPRTPALGNHDCIPPHRVDLPMSAVGPFGKNGEGQYREAAITGKVRQYSRNPEFPKPGGLTECVAAERRLERPSHWGLWQQRARWC
jgi:hypothetical protein